MRAFNRLLRDHCWVLGGLSLALPHLAASQPPPLPKFWEYVDVQVDLGGAQLVLKETMLNGTHKIQFVSSSTHPPGTKLRLGTTVQGCSNSVSGKLIVNGVAKWPAIQTNSVTVAVTVSQQGPVSVIFIAPGPQTFAVPLPALSPGAAQPIKVQLAYSSSGVGQSRTFYLAPLCQPLQPPELGSVAAGTAAVEPPLATPAKPLVPTPAQTAPQQARTGPALPPSNVKFAMDCQLKGIVAPVGDAYQPIAEVRPKMPWINPPATARIGVIVINAPPNYPASTFQYFKLPQSLWQQGGPHARVTLPSIKVLNVLVSIAGKQGAAPFALATCTATADAAPDSMAGYPLTP